MPAQNLWRVEIVNREADDATWDSIRSLVRLIHVDTGSALKFSGRQLPAWGFHQHEVVADKVVTHQDTVWNVEEHRYTKGSLDSGLVCTISDIPAVNKKNLIQKNPLLIKIIFVLCR